MGYTTEFQGQFQLDKPLEKDHAAYLFAFANSRRMKRDLNKLTEFVDLDREAAGLPIGEEGCYFVGGTGSAGQYHDTSIIDYNEPPVGQPGLWCKWVPTPDYDGIEWDGREKFYDYVIWIEYIIDHFLIPWGYTLNGTVKWRGEDFDDNGSIIVKNNIVRTK